MKAAIEGLKIQLQNLETAKGEAEAASLVYANEATNCTRLAQEKREQISEIIEAIALLEKGTK
jgi:hypothetical protein